MKRDESTPEPGEELRIVLPGGVVMAFRYIPAGELRMGQRGGLPHEEPVHRVVIPEPFWMGETAVTQAQFASWKRDHKHHFPGKEHRAHPAVRVTWDEAREYCRWLTKQCREQLPGLDWGADLPDEARWEFACRAGTATEYYNGDGEAALAEVGWYVGNAGEGTHPVGGKPANAWGLRDMHGNVWEWCADVFDARAYRKRIDGWKAFAWGMDDAGKDAEYDSDEERRDGSPFRVLRGGSWLNVARRCRSAFRLRLGPSLRGRFDGFRVCLARSSPARQASTAEAEPAPGGVARRQAGAKPDGAGAADRGKIDLASERLPGKPR